jgi:hypothetical protein
MSIICLYGGFGTLFYFPAEVIGYVCGRAVMNFSFLVLVVAVEIERGTSRLPAQCATTNLVAIVHTAVISRELHIRFHPVPRLSVVK